MNGWSSSIWLNVNPANDTAQPQQITSQSPATHRQADEVSRRGTSRPAAGVTNWNHMAWMRVSFPVCNIPNDENRRSRKHVISHQEHALHENATFAVFSEFRERTLLE